MTPTEKKDESLRAITYSVDLLIPGFYFWFWGIKIRIGGDTPDDNPYRYPGIIKSPAGIGLVLLIVDRFQAQLNSDREL